MPKPPQRKTEWKDQYTLLCESCGYILETLDQSLPCPECGKPIEDSLPHPQLGTPWQQNHHLDSLFRTWYLVLRHPTQAINQLQLQGEYGGMFVGLTLLFSSIIALAGILPVFRTGAPLNHFTLLFSIIIAISYCVISFITISLFCMRSQAYARRHEYRIPMDTAWQISAHASVYWILIPLGITLGFWSDAISKSADNYFHILTGSNASIRQLFSIIAGAMPIAGLFLGLAGFSIFASNCETRYRFANRIRPKDSTNG